MEEELIHIDRRIQELKEIKLNAIREKVQQKMKRKLEKKSYGKANTLIRVPVEFQDKVIRYIQEKRIENGRDKKIIQGPKLVRLMMRHRSWKYIIDDVIRYDFDDDYNEEQNVKYN